MSDDGTFNYESIPNGYYDLVLRNGNPIRRLWHVSKFERVLDYLPPENGGALLDVGHGPQRGKNLLRRKTEEQPTFHQRQGQPGDRARALLLARA